VQDYLLDAPVSVGDGFSFSGGKKLIGGVCCVENRLDHRLILFVVLKILF